MESGRLKDRLGTSLRHTLMRQTTNELLQFARNPNYDIQLGYIYL
jgi:3'-phosphoadenosine 5'-phosphosulfate sulfotransferase